MKTLASGDDPRGASGFANGQAYADALAEAGVVQGAAALEGFVQRVAAAVAEAEDPAALRRALLELYRREGVPDALAGTMRNSLLLGELAGRVAVLEDA